MRRPRSRSLSAVDLKGGVQVGIGQPGRHDFDGPDHQKNLVAGRQLDVPDGQMPGSGRRERTADEVKRRAHIALQDERNGDRFQRPNDRSSRAQRWSAFNGGRGSGHVITDFGSLNGSNNQNKTGGPPTPWALNAAQFVERMRGGDAHKVGIDASLNLPSTGRQATGFHETVDEKSTTPRSRNNRRNFVLV